MSNFQILTVQFAPKLAAYYQNTLDLTSLIKEQTKKLQLDLIVLPPNALSGYLTLDQHALYTRNFLEATKLLAKNTSKLSATIILPHFDDFITIKYGKISYLTKQHDIFTVKIRGITIALLHQIREIELTSKIDLIVITAITPFVHQPKNDTISSQWLKTAVKNKIPVIIHHLLHATEKTIFCGGTELYTPELLNPKIIPDFTPQSLLMVWENDQKKFKPILISKLPVITDFPKLNLPQDCSDLAKLYQALVFCLQSYCRNNGFTKVILGLSGGIDSALVLALAADAITPENIIALYLPSHYSSKLSEKIAKVAAANLKLPLTTILIDPLIDAFTQLLPHSWKKSSANATFENLQARIRAVILMAYANHEQALLLNTGNKSEAATGYTTLYGDMAGGLAILSDVDKTTVYELANYRNRINKIIPTAAITRPPTAELAPYQKDSDALPPYKILDAILHSYLSTKSKLSEIQRNKISAITIRNILKLLYRSEYKRRQSVVGPKITTHSLDTLVLPLTNELPK